MHRRLPVRKSGQKRPRGDPGDAFQRGLLLRPQKCAFPKELLAADWRHHETGARSFLGPVFFYRPLSGMRSLWSTARPIAIFRDPGLESLSSSKADPGSRATSR